MCAHKIDFWSELPSPLKRSVRDAFVSWSEKIYRSQKTVISSYFPSAMGGDMSKKDYLVNMPIENAPENYLAMGFGESSSPYFFEKFIDSGFYSKKKIIGWFSETMVVDTKRLKDRPVPSSYMDLAKPCYKGEVCIIGTPLIPDPLLPLFIKREGGMEACRSVIENIAGFGAPVNAIRHIGKTSNTFGSIFVMPLLFAEVCREIPSAVVTRPKEGFFAEPFILFAKDGGKFDLIYDFCTSREFENAFSEKQFLVSNAKNDRLIFSGCFETYFSDLEEIYDLLRKKLS